MEEMNNHTVSEDNLSGNKSANLLKIQELSGGLFVIPDFIVVSKQEDLCILPNIEKVAVRSDSIYEDTQMYSGAGEFETCLDVTNDIDSLTAAYTYIQSHAESKIGQSIGIMIQAMVEDPEYAGVVFGIDPRSNNADYYTVNYTQGLGNKVVDGNHNTETILIHKDYKTTNIFYSKLIDAVEQIGTYFDNQLLDIEFAYKDNIIYILQVRSLTAITNSMEHIRNSVRHRLFNYLQSCLNERFLGDMIDINPAELLGGSRERLTNTFFNYIFPQRALLSARSYFDYGDGSGMDYIVFDKAYIDLGKNIYSFLPQTLSESEVLLFQQYYSDLLINDPGLQNKLDTIYYPISLDRTKEIIKKLKTSDDEKRLLLSKFVIFFDELHNKCNKLAEEYISTEKKLIQKYFPGALSIDHLHDNIPKKSIDQLLDDIVRLCHEFAKHARGAFYFMDNNVRQNLFYHYYRYSNQLEILDRTLGHSENVNVQLSNGFDFLQTHTYTFSANPNTLYTLDDSYIPSNKEILETARENIKYMFMLYITTLGKKIKKDCGALENLQHADFNILINRIGDTDFLTNYLHRRYQNNQLYQTLSMPSELYNTNHPGIFKLLKNEGIYFDFGLDCIEGQIFYCDNLQNYNYHELQCLTKDKIILITNATPEIDSYLPYIQNAKGLVTKFGGPCAHIVLKIREMNQQMDLKFGLVVGYGDMFDKIKQKQRCNIDFINHVIT